MRERCIWCLDKFEAYQAYHDDEWGVPVHDDKKHFEFLILEGAQAGLSWATILKRRAGYRNAFADFDVEKVAVFDAEKIDTMLQDSNLIRNKLKIKSAVRNAQLFIDIQKEFGSFSHYIWGFVGHKTIVNRWASSTQNPATSPQSDALSKDLKKRGFKFCGSIIMYSHMQACGLVNDHSVDCYRYTQV